MSVIPLLILCYIRKTIKKSENVDEKHTKYKNEKQKTKKIHK